MEPPGRSKRSSVLTLLEAALLEALRPRGWRERVRVRLGWGFTPLQVYERLTDPRWGVAEVAEGLSRLAKGGRLRHARERMSVVLNTKGPRDIVVDTYRLLS